MACEKHPGHAHAHGEGCGHTPVRHRDHTDYAHDGHLHAPHADHSDEHVLEVDRTRPSTCAPVECEGRHGDGCGHAPVPHGNHVDYVVGIALHHPHEDHCDLHGLTR